MSFPTFARTIPSNWKVSKSVVSLLREFNWTRVAVVAGNGPVWKEAASRLKVSYKSETNKLITLTNVTQSKR